MCMCIVVRFKWRSYILFYGTGQTPLPRLIGVRKKKKNIWIVSLMSFEERWHIPLLGKILISSIQLSFLSYHLQVDFKRYLNKMKTYCITNSLASSEKLAFTLIRLLSNHEYYTQILSSYFFLLLHSFTTTYYNLIFLPNLSPHLLSNHPLLLNYNKIP